MAYQFTNQDAAKFKINRVGGSTYFNLSGISASETDPEVIVGGIGQLLEIVGLTNVLNIEDASRTVTEDVVEV